MMSTQFSIHPNDPVVTGTTPMANDCEHIDGISNGDCYPMAEAEYEEVAENAELFWEKLEAFHRSFGTKFGAPLVGGIALDLHRLFVEVTSRGGIQRVVRDRRWKEVTVIFSFPTPVTSTSFVLRKYYISLLFHFEQVYYFHKEAPSTSNDEVPELELGSSVTGSVDAKFENGYVISVNIGSGILKGVLYHFPHTLQISGSSTTETPRNPNRKRSHISGRDPSRPKPNRSGYTFFFAEQYAKLRPSYYGQEKAISKKIGSLWSELTEAEKQVYQEKGRMDKERYKMEMLDYRSNLVSRTQ